jgi:putative hydrolase of HD superfamily
MVAIDNERLTQQIAFLLEIDGLKQVLRRSLILGSSRRENSAEHSWR